MFLAPLSEEFDQTRLPGDFKAAARAFVLAAALAHRAPAAS